MNTKNGTITIEGTQPLTNIMNNSLEIVFDNLTQLYYALYPDSSGIAFSVVLTDSLKDTYKKLRPDLTELIEAREDAADFNGEIVLPHKVGENIHILMNTIKINDYTSDGSMTWIGTFAHELTHAIDYHDMATREELIHYDQLQMIDGEYFVFQMWSEYHARKRGYSFLRNYFCHVEQTADFFKDKDQQLDYIIATEWPTHKARYKQDLDECIYSDQRVYLTMQILGRYSVWGDLFPDVFNEQSIKRDFMEIPWISDLLGFLRGHESLDEVYPCLHELEKILQYWY